MDLEVFRTLKDSVPELQQAGAFKDTRFQGFAAEDFLKGGRLNETSIRANLAINVALAIELMMLQAVNLELGTCWISSFDEKAVKKTTGISDRYSIDLL